MNANLRAAPAGDARILATLKAGSPVEVLGPSGDWLEVISMGSPQILGSNHAEVGYDSVEAMFDAFSAGDRAQIVGLFDFVQGPGGASSKILALQRRDFDTFAAKYNGPGKAAEYGAALRTFFTAFRSLAPTEPVAATA